MQKFNLFRHIFILTLIIALFVSLALICDDDDASFDLTCNTDYTAISFYRDLIDHPPYSSSLSYSNEHPASSKQFILYVSRQEKSPPNSRA